MSLSPKVLFLPVSSPEGIGEYMRSVIVAEAIIKQWPSAEIHFVLSRKAPYAQSCPFPTTLLDQSPTKEINAVNKLLTQQRPDLVVFDASGRQSQLQMAHKVGAKVVFISQHRRKRSRGMKVGRARVTDSHWVVQPEFIIGPISIWDRYKLKLLGKDEPLFTGPIFTNPDAQSQTSLFERFGVEAGEYVIFNAGSGGHKVGSRLAADIFADVACGGYKSSGLKSLMVFGPNYPMALPDYPGVVSIQSLSNGEFINLLAAARGAVISGGDTLLQAIALQVPVLTVAVSKDQPPRIAACSEHKLVLSCGADVDMMLSGYQELLKESTCTALKEAMVQGPSINGLELGMAEIRRLLRA